MSKNKIKSNTFKSLMRGLKDVKQYYEGKLALRTTIVEVGEQKMNKKFFINALNKMQADVHNNAKSKGWWEEDRNNGELLALIHSEVSEVLEAYRTGNKEDSVFPGFTEAEIELADVVIRCLDFAQARNFKLAEAILMKHEYNKGRPYKHNKKF